ncbi:MAG: hypothetical protein HYS70_01245, partial [Nitrospinae bacterium]|nr:hypothetical protein [Nitrospinota bacterium]
MASKAFLAEVIQAVGKTLKDPASRIVRAARGPKHPGVPLRSFWVTIGYKKAPT